MSVTEIVLLVIGGLFFGVSFFLPDGKKKEEEHVTKEEIKKLIDEEMANVVIYLFHDFLLGRRCAKCGKTFTDREQQNRCPFCGAPDPEWTLERGTKT